jgi:glycosyltransferase 2 family protein
MARLHPAWLALALLLFNASQWVSAARLKVFFGTAGVHLSFRKNLALYYIGMFYNLFLPGGIGGDGYKVYLINRRLGAPVKSLVQVLLHDRLNGLAGLTLVLFLLVLAFLPATLRALLPALAAALLAGLAAYFLALFLFFRKLLPVMPRVTLLSCAVQGLQTLAAFSLLQGLSPPGVPGAYLILFLCSSVAAVIPFTIGGVGARELVFVYGYHYMQIDQHSAVALSLLFFLITALSSLTGILLRQDPWEASAGGRSRTEEYTSREPEIIRNTDPTNDESGQSLPTARR